MVFVCFNKREGLGRHGGVKAGTEGSSLTLPSPPRGYCWLVYLSHCNVCLPPPPGRSLTATCCGPMTVPNAHSSVTPSGSNPGKLDSWCQIIQLCALLFFLPCLFLRCDWLPLLFLSFLYGCTFCNGEFDISTMLFLNMRYVKISDVKVEGCSSINIMFKSHFVMYEFALCLHMH